MPNRRDVALGWGDRDWEGLDPGGQWRAPARPDYDRNRDYERNRNFGRGPDLPRDAFYGRDSGGRDYDRSPESARYDAEDFGGHDRDTGGRYSEWRNRFGGAPPHEGRSDYDGYRRRPEYGGYGARGERTGRSYFGRGPRGYRRTDERISEEINDRLAYDPDLDPSDVDVKVQNGIVTLSGVVEDRGAKRLAEDIAEDVFGVDDVNNELKVRHGLWARITGEHVEDREVAVETQREGTRPGTADTTKRAATARSSRSTPR